MTKKKKAIRTHKGSQRRVAQQLRVAKAIELHLEGSTYEEIAKHLNWKSKQSAWDAVQKYLKEVQVDCAENMRKKQFMRIEKMIAVPYLRAQGGDSCAAQTVLQLMQHEARLAGLNAPAKAELTGRDGEPLHAAPPTLNIILTTDDESDQPQAAQETEPGVSQQSH